MIRVREPQTLLLAGGGTGGHLFPGVAVAEAFERRVPGARALLAVTDREAGSAHAAACPFEQVRVGSPKLPAGARHVPLFGARMAGAVGRSLVLLRDARVCAVVGLGGYGSVAPVLAARMAGVPSVLLEQNAVPGRATRALARLAGATATSFEATAARGLRGRVVHTGNPLREDVLRPRAAHAEFGLEPGLPVLGVLGGSLGATGVSARVAEALPALAHALGGASFQVLHGTGGDEAADALRSLYAAHGIRASVRPFFRDMAAVYGTVDVALCRAGGTTVAELAACGLPSLLVPYPHHADMHQRENARALVECGAAMLLEESDMSPAAVVARVAPLLRDPARRARMARAARRVARPDAAQRVVDLLLSLLRRGTFPPAAAPAAVAREGSPA